MNYLSIIALINSPFHLILVTLESGIRVNCRLGFNKGFCAL